MHGVVPDLAGRRLVVVYSHADWDHVWGTAGLTYRDATIVGHARCLERFDADVPVTLEPRSGSPSPDGGTTSCSCRRASRSTRSCPWISAG